MKSNIDPSGLIDDIETRIDLLRQRDKIRDAADILAARDGELAGQVKAVEEKIAQSLNLSGVDSVAYDGTLYVLYPIPANEGVPQRITAQPCLILSGPARKPTE
jgi:hypothetical protein